jgi:hypothetical protein
MVRHFLQHHLNALHVLALLRRAKLPRAAALAAARRWERLVHPLLYPAVRRLTLVRVAAPAVRTYRIPHLRG